MTIEEEIQRNLQSAFQALERQDWAAAQVFLQKALALEPRLGQARLALSQAFYEQGNYTASRDQLIELIREYPDDLQLVQNYRLVLQALQTDPIEGLKNLSQEVPGSTAVLLALEQVALEEEDTESANRWLNQLIAVEPVSLWGRLNRASGYRWVDDIESARQELDRMVADDPENPEAYLRRAEFLTAWEDYPGAIADYEKVSQLVPETSLGYQRCGDIHFSQEKYSQALEMYQKALQRQPDNRDLRVAEGLCYENIGAFDQALAVYSALIEQTPDHPDGYYYRGRVYAAQQKNDLAEADFKKAIELAPNFPQGYQALGKFYLDQNRLDEAEATFKKAIQVDPENADAHFYLGSTYMALADYPKARRSFRKVVELAPESPLGYFNLGNVYLSLKRYREAIKAYKAALERSPKLAEAQVRMGEAYQYSGKLDEAIRAFQKTIEIAPDWALGYGMLGQAYAAKDEHEKALTAFQKAIELEPQWTEIYYLLGQSYFELEKPESAIETFRKATESDPKSPKTFAQLGQAYQFLQRYPEALDAYNKMIELAPDEPFCYLLRAELFQEMAQRAVVEESQAPAGSQDQPSRAAPLYKLAEIDLIHRATLAGQDTEAYLDLGSFYFGLGQLAEALEAVTKILEWEADSNRVHYALALLYENMSEDMDALKHYSAAIRLDNQDAFSYAGRGRVYLNNDDYARALPDLNKALELIPDDPQTLTYRGILWEMVKNYPQALEDYQRALSLLPEEPQAHKNVANMLMSLEGYDLAVSEYEQALQYKPDDFEALTNLADAHRMWANDIEAPEHYSLAIQIADRLLQIADPDSIIYAIKGYSLFSSGQPGAGLAAFDRALELNPANLWALNHKARFLYKKGDYEAALAAFQKLKDSGPDYRLGDCVGEVVTLRKLGRESEADSLMSATLPPEPKAEDYLNRCYAFDYLEEYQQALADAEAAVRLDPSQWGGYNMVAWILAEYLKRDYERAIQMAELGVQRAREMVAKRRAEDLSDPKLAARLSDDLISLGQVLDTLGWAYYRAGDLDKARQYLAEGVGYQEQDQQKRYHLEVVQKALEARQ